MATVQLADVIVPEIFNSYMVNDTETKNALIQSGVLVRDQQLDNLLVGGGLTFEVPSFNDLDGDDADDVVDDDPANLATPSKIQTSQEIAVRLSRHKAWSNMNLVNELAGADPLARIIDRAGNYWSQRLQKAFVASINGVIADNAAAPTGTDTHTAGDLTRDLSTLNGGAFASGVTDFTAKAFLETTLLLGDAMNDVSIVMMHSQVYHKAQVNNLIQFIPDARGETRIATFLDKRVVVDDGMPNSGGVFDTWIFGPGAVRLGVGTPDVPSEIDRAPRAGNGAGEDTLHTRTQWMVHPVGHAYLGRAVGAAVTTANGGGPSNADLALAANWSRVWPERKQIKFARLVSREF